VAGDLPFSALRQVEFELKKFWNIEGETGPDNTFGAEQLKARIPVEFCDQCFFPQDLGQGIGVRIFKKISDGFGFFFDLLQRVFDEINTPCFLGFNDVLDEILGDKPALMGECLVYGRIHKKNGEKEGREQDFFFSYQYRSVSEQKNHQKNDPLDQEK